MLVFIIGDSYYSLKKLRIDLFQNSWLASDGASELNGARSQNIKLFFSSFIKFEFYFYTISSL